MREKSRAVITILLTAGIALAVLITYLYSSDSPRVSLENSASSVISLDDISFEIARAPEDRQKGLSGRASLATSSGMAFVFERPGSYELWMKDMKFSIDMIWLDQDFIVVGLESNVSPDTYPRSFVSQEKSSYVIELHAGEAVRRNITIGTKVQIRAVDNSN